MDPVERDAIRRVRSLVDRTIPECRAALLAHGGDVDAAVRSLRTPLEARIERSAAIFRHLPSPGPPPPPPLLERVRRWLAPPASPVHDRASLHVAVERARWIRGFDAGTPSPGDLERLEALHREWTERPLPAAYRAALSRWDGLSCGADWVLWPASALRERHADIACEGAPFAIGDLYDVGTLDLRDDEVWLDRFESVPRALRLAADFDAFLTALVERDLDLLAVTWRAER